MPMRWYNIGGKAMPFMMLQQGGAVGAITQRGGPTGGQWTINTAEGPLSFYGTKYTHGLENQVADYQTQVGDYQSQIADLQNQLAGFQNPTPTPTPVPVPEVPYVEGTPNVDTGIPQGGAARPYIDQYFAGESPFGQLDFSPYQGTQGGGAQSYGYTPTVRQEAPVVEEPVVEDRTPTPPPAAVPDVPVPGIDVTHPATKEYIESQEVLPAVVPTDPNYVNNPTIIPREEWTSPTVTTPTGIEAPIITPGEPGVADPVGTHTPVADIPALPSNVGEAIPTGIRSDDVVQVEDNYTGIPNIDEAFTTNFTGVDSTGEEYTQPVVVVDSSPTGNLSQPTSINVGSRTPYTHVSGDPSLSSTNQLAQQESITQPGRYEQQPDGTYKFVEGKTELKDDKDNKEQAKAAVENLVKSGASSTQVSQAAFKAGLDAKDRAALTAQAQANAGPSRREQTEINARAAAAKAAADKAAAEREAHLATLTPEGQKNFVAEEAIASRDRGDLKKALRDNGIRYKKDDSTSKLVKLLENRPKVEAPPPPPPQPVATPAPTPPPQRPVEVTPQPVVVPPQPTPQVTPAPVVAPEPVLPTAPDPADPFDWANNPNNPANAGKVIPVTEWDPNQTPSKGK